MLLEWKVKESLSVFKLSDKSKTTEKHWLTNRRLIFFSLVCDSFVRLKKWRKENKINRQLLCFSVGKSGLTDEKKFAVRGESSLIGWKLNNWMTKLRTHNTRLCSQAGWRALSGFCTRIHFVAVRQRMLPQTARAHSLGRYGQV